MSKMEVLRALVKKIVAETAYNKFGKPDEQSARAEAALLKLASLLDIPEADIDIETLYFDDNGEEFDPDEDDYDDDGIQRQETPSPDASSICLKLNNTTEQEYDDGVAHVFDQNPDTIIMKDYTGMGGDLSIAIDDVMRAQTLEELGESGGQAFNLYIYYTTA